MTGEFVSAVHIMVYLNHKKTVVSSCELADNVCTPSPRIRQILMKLKKAGMVESTNGAKGGYIAKKGASSISLYDIALALEEYPVPLHWKSGKDEAPCLISSGMAHVFENINEDLNSLCYKKLKTINIRSIEKQLLSAKKL